MQDANIRKKSYSDEELAEFKNHIEKKIEQARLQIASFLESIENISDTKNGDGDWMDDTSNNQDLEMFYSMLARQRKHVLDLENALIRIHNKHYGVCVVTGQLIDKRRLMAVPTTTKSLEAKKTKKVEPQKRNRVEPKTTSSFTRIIKTTGGTTHLNAKEEEDDLEEDDLGLLEMGMDEININLADDDAMED